MEQEVALNLVLTSSILTVDWLGLALLSSRTQDLVNKYFLNRSLPRTGASRQTTTNSLLHTWVTSLYY